MPETCPKCRSLRNRLIWAEQHGLKMLKRLERYPRSAQLQAGADNALLAIESLKLQLAEHSHQEAS